MARFSTESIIIPMNPKGDYSGGSTPGSIIAQEWFSQREGKVIVSFDKGCKYADSVEKPKLGFFRDTRKGRGLVTHRFEIIDIVSDSAAIKYLEAPIDPWSKKFLPPWRRELYYKARLNPKKSRTWLLINNIRKLKIPQNLDYFDKKPSQSFVYSSKGSDLEFVVEKADPDDFIDDVIFRSVRSGVQFTEDDLELIIWARLVKSGAKYLRRQRVPEGEALRLDLLVETAKSGYMVIELKRGTATSEALHNQLLPYINGIKKEFGVAEIKGTIIARDASADLEKELQNPENANISFVSYGFSFRLDKISEF